MDRSLRLGLWAGALLCFATAASAVDGVIEINQAAAMAGGITPGDTLGFPVTISQPGSYRLTGNLDVSGESTPENVTAIEVTTHNATIDLNGFEIAGPAECNGNPPAVDITCAPTGMGVGILRLGASRITVRNGTVRGMGGDGINLGNESLVEEVRATGNGGDGIQVTGESIVTKCIATLNRDSGINLDSIGNIAVNNIASRNGSSGLAGNQMVASGNLALANFQSGIGAGDNSTIVGNSSSNNGTFGLAASAATGYTNNVFNDNTGGQVSGGIEMPPNVCGDNLTCP